MLGDRFANSGAEVARNAQLDWNLALGEFFDQVGIVGGGEGVANALGVQVECSPDGFWRSGFAGVRGQAQAVVFGVGVDAAEKFGRSFLFVAANADADDLAVSIT